MDVLASTPLIPKAFERFRSLVPPDVQLALFFSIWKRPSATFQAGCGSHSSLASITAYMAAAWERALLDVLAVTPLRVKVSKILTVGTTNKQSLKTWLTQSKMLEKGMFLLTSVVLKALLVRSPCSSLCVLAWQHFHVRCCISTSASAGSDLEQQQPMISMFKSDNIEVRIISCSNRSRYLRETTVDWCGWVLGNLLVTTMNWAVHRL